MRYVPLVGLSGLASTKHCFLPSIIGVVYTNYFEQEVRDAVACVFMGCVILLELFVTV